VTAAPDREAVRAQVVRLMSRVFGADPSDINDRTTAADIERWDSLSLLTVLLGIERSLGVAVSSDAAAEVADVGGLVELVYAGLHTGAAPVAR